MKNNNLVNIAIPMAGAGSRFTKAGYTLPKPFIDVAGKMMIERVLENLSCPNGRFILLALKEHQLNYPNYFKKLTDLYNNIEIVTISKLTLGATCTVLAAHEYIFDNTPLVIANSDQIVDINIADFIDNALTKKLDGSILTFRDNDPKWSFVKMDNAGLVTEIREKAPISDTATAGIYFFSKGQDFVRGAIDMIVNNDTVNNEFYVAPVYNHLIKKQKKIGIYDIKISQMHGTGTPQDLNKYLEIIG